MFKCMLCHEISELKSESPAHRGLCKTCHSDLTNYKRYRNADSVTTMRSIKNNAVRNRIEANKRNGGYVPKWYDTPSVTAICKMCGMNYNAIDRNAKCTPCYKTENSYRILAARDQAPVQYKKPEKADGETVKLRSRSKLKELDMYYTNKHTQGLEVPVAFLERIKKGMIDL